jgi:hypothetical protein
VMEMKGTERIAELIRNDAVLISGHARVRMFERNISTDDLMEVLSSGEIIEEYPDDDPCPSALILGFINHAAYHVVIAICTDHLRIITVYIPEDRKWTNYRKRRTEP